MRPGLITLLTLALAQAGPEAKVFETKDYRIRVVPVVQGLSHAYCLTFLPNGDILFTEEDRGLRLIRGGKLVPELIPGTPEVFKEGQGGLMDLALHPRFRENNLLYFTYNKPGPQGVTIAVGRGRFDGSRLTEVGDVLVADAWSKSTGHLSSRIVFGRDGMLYFTVTVRSETDRAQRPNDHAGKILRVRDDGSAPPDNPFVGRAGYRPEIFTIGHRNQHGIAVHPETGELWEIEHGDEANILKPGLNYGWPYHTMGGEGGGTAIGPAPAGVQLVVPRIGWNPSLGVSGMAFYTGDKFPKWKNNLFVGGSRTQGVTRIAIGQNGADVREDLFNIGERIRDVRQGPDGLIYFITDADAGAIMRIEPAN
jgi:glucose/arabinose dehydrogenase